MDGKKAKVTIEEDGKATEIETRVIENPEKLKAISSASCWEIVKLLSTKPYYPAEIAKKLGMHEQKVYYHIKQLENNGIIRVSKAEEVKGALAKYYEAPDICFTFLPKEARGKATSGIAGRGIGKKELDKDIAAFFSPIISRGAMNAKIVVGSPEPHGKFKARARDNHFAAELSAFLGSICEKIEFPLVYLDTMVKPLEEENSNLIIIGGPITNNLCNSLNSKHLPIQFKPSGGHWVLHSKISGKEYSEDAIGVIEKIKHPFFKNRAIILIAGKRNTGTIAAIVAIAKKTKEMAKPNLFDKTQYSHVVEGLDLDSDGLIDEVEIKE